LNFDGCIDMLWCVSNFDFNILYVIDITIIIIIFSIMFISLIDIDMYNISCTISIDGKKIALNILVW